MLEARGLTKCYASIPAVNNVSFAVRPGEILGYLGPNGSGKSTTVKMITGLMEPTRGEVLFHGSSIKDDLLTYKKLLIFLACCSPALARKVMLAFIWPWALLVCFPLSVHAWGWAIGTGHVALLITSCGLLAQLLLRGFNKIPFACTYTVWKQSSTMMVLLFLLGFWAFAFLLPDLEHSLLRQTPFSLWALSALMMLASAALRRLWKVENEDESLMFEETR